MERTEIERRFVYHAPTEETRLVHEEIRRLTLDFASRMNELMEESREKALFYTALEEASFWAHADIARNRQ